MNKLIIIPTLLILSAAACAPVGPDFKSPKMTSPVIWESESAAENTRAEKREEDIKKWWCNFNDPELEKLIDWGLRSNNDIELAMERIRQARTVLAQEEGSFWPGVTFGGAAQRQNTKITNSKINNFLGISGGRTSTTNTFRVGFDANWELDILGGIRRSVEAAEAGIRAADEDFRDTAVTLAGDIGTNYVDLRGFQTQLQITRENLRTQKHSAEITRKRFEAGFTNSLDVQNAQAQVETTKAQIPALESSIKQSIYQLSLLLGEQPVVLIKELEAEEPLPSLPGQVPVGLPAELLDRRPDIRMAKEQLHAAVARIGVAIADLYPKISLTASANLSNSGEISKWLKSMTRLIAAGVAADWNIFSGGRLEASVEENRSLAQQALIEYEKTYLTALQEVESAWTAYDREIMRAKLLENAVNSNLKAVEISMKLYTAGETDFINVLTAERSLYATQSSLAQSRINAAKSLVSLYKALGGGWEEF